MENVFTQGLMGRGGRHDVERQSAYHKDNETVVHQQQFTKGFLSYQTTYSH